MRRDLLPSFRISNSRPPLKTLKLQKWLLPCGLVSVTMHAMTSTLHHRSPHGKGQSWARNSRPSSKVGQLCSRALKMSEETRGITKYSSSIHLSSSVRYLAQITRAPIPPMKNIAGLEPDRGLVSGESSLDEWNNERGKVSAPAENERSPKKE